MRTLFPARGTAAYDLLKHLLNDFQEEERPCAQDPDLWWMTDYPSVTEAKRRCKGEFGNGQVCPLLETCGLYAVVAVEPVGVWGGMSPDDRLSMRRRLSKAKARLAKREERRVKALAQQTTTEEQEVAS